MDLFDFSNEYKSLSPLADRMRPKTLDDFIGQKHILSKDSLLMRAVKTGKLGSCIFYGPPGTGKTTLAGIIAETSKANFVKLNAVSSGVADAKAVIEEAKNKLKMYSKRTYLLLDECHRWSKAQSDCVLSAIEDGSIIFIGSTTENPYVAMTRAIVSRCRIFELKQLEDSDIIAGLKKAAKDKINGLGNFNLEVDEDAFIHFAWAANGDLRNALSSLELAVLSTPPQADAKIIITKKIAEQSSQRKAISVDDSMYYDMLSAFCKSLRGSDPNAALYWAFRLVEAGCDPQLIFRRLLAHASEDVGMADSNALTVVTSAYLAYERMGIAEGSIPMAHAIIYVTTAPKSNSVVVAKGKAIEAVNRTGDNNVPHYLRDKSYPHTIDDGSDYIYPHDYGGYVNQQYLPDGLKNEVFYVPSDNGKEADVKKFMQYIKQKSDEREEK